MYDLEWPWMADMHSAAKMMRLSEPTTKIWMKIDPHYPRQKCRPLTLVSGAIRLMRIFAGVLWRGGAKRQWGNRTINIDFQGFWTLRLRHLRKWGQRYYIVLFYCRLSTDRATSENNWVKMKIDTHCQRRKSSAGTLVSGNIRFVWIFGRVL